MNIYEKLAAIMAAIDGVDKKGRNKEQGYDYVRATDVAITVRQECIKQKLLIIPSVIEDEHFIFERIAGKPSLTIRLKVEFIVVDAEDPKTSFSFYGVGYGLDSGDKGVYKAMTGALKYGLRSLLLVPDETDPENDAADARPETKAAIGSGIAAARAAAKPAPPAEVVAEAVAPKMATVPQREKVRAQARSKGLDDAKLKILGRLVTGKGSSTEWVTTDIDKMLESIENEGVIGMVLEGEVVG